ncbi:MAG: glycosyltransferase family 1 protein, partial [Ruminococcus sp.]
MKKICYVTTISLTLKSFVIQSAKYLKENTDWDIVMICDNDDEFQDVLPEGIRYIPVSMKRGLNFDGMSVIRKLVKIFKEEKFDLVQYSTPNASLYVSIAAKIAKVPVRLYCQWGMVYVGFSGIKRKIFKCIEKFVCKNSTEIEPDSYGNLDFAHKEGLYPKNKGRVIWNGSACGVDLSKFDISRKDE